MTYSLRAQTRCCRAFLGRGFLRDLYHLRVKQAGTNDGFISGNLLKNDTFWSRSIRVSSPSRWETQMRTGAPNPARRRCTQTDPVRLQRSDEVELRLIKCRKAHRGALFEVKEDREGIGSGRDISFDTRAIAVRHIFHQFWDVEARQGLLDRPVTSKKDLRERMVTRTPSNLVVVVCGDASVLSFLPRFEFQVAFRIAFRLLRGSIKLPDWVPSHKFSLRVPRSARRR